MKLKFVLIFIVFCICLSVSGCSRYIRMAISIPNSSGQETVLIDVAVDSSGVKHIVRRVCYVADPFDCMIVYTKAVSGQASDVYSWTSVSGFIGAYDPVIEVTDNGVAAIAWETARTTGGSYATLYSLSTDLTTVNEVDPGYVASGVQLAARGDSIYAIQNIYQGGHNYIRYRELVGGNSGGWVSEHDPVATDNILYDAAVSPSGSLYVTFWRSTYADIMYADNYGTNGDMTHRFGLIGGANDYTQSRIDVNGIPEVVYVTYTHEFNPAPSVSDILVIAHCPAASCVDFGDFQFELPLDSSKEWDVNGPTDIVADITNVAYYAFAAYNSDTGDANREIFEGFFQYGTPYFTGNASNTPQNDGGPTIGLMWSLIPVTAWRTANGEFYQFDAYPFEIPPLHAYASLRKVYQTGFTFEGDIQMDCNADWGAGVWIENQASKQSYVIFNTYPGFLPLIMK